MRESEICVCIFLLFAFCLFNIDKMYSAFGTNKICARHLGGEKSILSNQSVVPFLLWPKWK